CFKEKLAEKHACYVLITCDPPSCDGKMQVEMSYEGDATLAAYILQGAQLHIDEKEMVNHATSQGNKIHYLD
ncbi:MAG TPA: hypothetical protein VGP47_08530, partial [Parachlamydiaceae bacterium]|nr:hypothetical protein [Parachlamydiaceae bacterium]